jgi:hypothetical protein
MLDGYYKSPALHSEGFNCPHCGIYARQTWEMIRMRHPSYHMAECDACGSESLWREGVIVFPIMGIAPPSHIQMPPEAYALYSKARQLSTLNASVAMIYVRMALVAVMRYAGAKGEDLAADVEQFCLQGLGTRRFWASLEQVRLTGSRKVGLGQLCESDDERMLSLGFYVLNAMVEECVASPNTLASFYADLSDPEHEAPKPKIDPTFFERL